MGWGGDGKGAAWGGKAGGAGWGGKAGGGAAWGGNAGGGGWGGNAWGGKGGKPGGGMMQVWQPMFNPGMKGMKGKGKGDQGLRGFPKEQKVWIGGLPPDSCSVDMNKQLKQHLCSAGGTCLFAEVGKSGQGGAAFKTADEAAAAIGTLNGSLFNGVPIQVDVWTKKS
eukprot:TRINITY_DN32773_c0_g1_i1.p1 TRINITY_DN32773_c0_g1~~TRINITY_DN32773_c0_g1_i1.p1  ORF type:complete len:167 (+),score=54.96 TRINITY_DN32773_c0_g1_i1:98-598(+)